MKNIFKKKQDKINNESIGTNVEDLLFLILVKLPNGNVHQLIANPVDVTNAVNNGFKDGIVLSRNPLKGIDFNINENLKYEDFDKKG